MSFPPFSHDEQIALAREANWAPSVHNVQPARWRFRADGMILLFEERSRRLSIADARGVDALRSVGAACEGMVLALSRLGHGVSVARKGLDPEPGSSLALIAELSAAGPAPPDPLRAHVDTRATYRGVFALPNEADRETLKTLAEISGNLTLATDPADIAEAAKLYDEESLRLLRDRGYRAELVSWLRLNPNHPNYALDGLNAEAMALSRLEAAVAGFALGPRVFDALDRMGLSRLAAGEGAKTRNAAALGLFHRPLHEDAFQSGRLFYRLWLELEAAGFVLCPMSVLSDDPDIAARLMTNANVLRRSLINVFRIGRRPPGIAAHKRARLIDASLLV